MIKTFIYSIIASVVICTPIIAMGDLELKWLQYKNYYPNMQARHFAYIWKECTKQGVPITDICAIVNNESHYDDQVVSKSMDAGLLQINKVHWFGSIEEMLELHTNVRMGVSIYKSALKKARGDKRTAFRYYNAGENSHERLYDNWKYVDAILKDIRMSDQVIKNLCYLEILK